MKIITDNYLNGVDKMEIAHIVKDLKDYMYARLEINRRHSYDYTVIIPQDNKTCGKISNVKTQGKINTCYG